jgi:CDP-diacylglycerol--serine O-phosphatidyltransferase
MNIKKHIPNFITILNLVCGVGAILFFSKQLSENEKEFLIDELIANSDNNYLLNSYEMQYLVTAPYHITLGLFLILIATLLDFLDGFAAKILKVQSEIGAQLDSLADMITFGLAPGLLFYTLADTFYAEIVWLKFMFILIPVFSALRLAKFNVDTEQTTYFKGLATPANAILWVGISFVFLNEINIPYYIMTVLVVVLSLLMVSNFKMFSLKVSNLKLEGDNIYRVTLIGLTIITLILCSLLANIFFAIPIIIILYILLSIPYHLNHNKK